jgi:hypothetical protein
MGSYLPSIRFIVFLVKSIILFSLNRFVLPRYSEKLRSKIKINSTPQFNNKHSITYSSLEVQFVQLLRLHYQYHYQWCSHNDQVVQLQDAWYDKNSLLQVVVVLLLLLILP